MWPSENRFLSPHLYGVRKALEIQPHLLRRIFQGSEILPHPLRRIFQGSEILLHPLLRPFQGLEILLHPLRHNFQALADLPSARNMKLNFINTFLL